MMSYISLVIIVLFTRFKCLLVQDGNTCLHMKEALKNPKMVDLLVQAFWEKQMSVRLANKVLRILLIIVVLLFTMLQKI